MEKILNLTESNNSKEDEDNLKDQTLESILPVHKKLHDDYNLNLRYEDSGKFFIRESKMKRLYKYEEGIQKEKLLFQKI